MSASEFDRDLEAWLDGELPPACAAAMQAAVDASPELAERAALEREFDQRMRRALASDAGSVETVRGMLAKARTQSVPAGRMLRLPRGAMKIAAGLLIAVTGGMWWLCIPPFECAFMQALEVAAEDRAAVPGAAADEALARSGLPAEVDGALAAHPAAIATLDFWFWHLTGVRLDYVRPDGSVFHTVLCEKSDVHPSIRRSVERDGEEWWMGEMGGSHVVAFTVKDGTGVCAVTGTTGDESVYAAAKALRASLR